MQERAKAAEAARQLRSSLWDGTAMGEVIRSHVDYSRPRRGVWMTTWTNLPGFSLENGLYVHSCLPGWTYKRAEIATEMIPDLEALAERGMRPTEATGA
jgi:hypothetical protein